MEELTYICLDCGEVFTDIGKNGGFCPECGSTEVEPIKEK